MTPIDSLETWVANATALQLAAQGGGCRPPLEDTEEAAMQCPGCCVKSKERKEDSNWPKYFGILAVFDKDLDKATVISQPDIDDQHIVWIGTLNEYFTMWDCD